MGEAWTGSICLRIGIGGGLCRTVMNIRVAWNAGVY